MRTETLAVVFTDIKGYTATTSSQTHQENARMLRRVERVIQPVVRAYSGHVIKSIGDSYMVVFRSPTLAAQCAIAIQDLMHQYNVTAREQDAVHLRIAMNIGEVRVDRGDVFGEPVNIAARLEGVTPADEIYLSEAIYLTMNRSEIPTAHVGEYELKGIPEPVTVYRVKKANESKPQGDNDSTVVTETVTPESALNKTLPYGGRQLVNWRRARWIRRAYQAVWVLAAAGLVGAAYLRYRPTSDYGVLVEAARVAAEQGDAMGVLAAVGQIPPTAVEERAEVRRFRRKAVGILFDKKDPTTAATELNSLLDENGRDAEALVLRAKLERTRGKIDVALRDLADALKIDPGLAKMPDVVATVVEGYKGATTRKTADQLVESVLREAAVPALAAAVREPAGVDRKALVAMALRLEKLGAGSEVDWVLLSIEDLKSTSCSVKKGAITRLLAEGDDRAVGPLMKLSEGKGCATKDAKAAAQAILEK
jgi:class 3 adenylate cyclase